MCERVPAMPAPSGMIPIEKFAKAKDLEVDDAIETIKNGSYQGRLIHGEWYVYEDQLSKDPRPPAKKPEVKEHSEYTLARVLHKIFIVLGWLIIIFGTIAAFVAMGKTYSNSLAAAIPGLTICFAGIIIIAAAQITLAVIDTADNSRRILEALRARN